MAWPEMQESGFKSFKENSGEKQSQTCKNVAIS